MLRHGSLLLLGLTLCQSIWSQTDTPPTAPYVEDHTASLLDTDLRIWEAELAEREAEQKISIKVIVYAEETEPAEIGAERALQLWRAGKEQEESIVLLLYKKEAKAAIAATYSLEHLLPAGERSRLIRYYLNPELKQGRLKEAVEQGLRWLDLILAGQRIPERTWEQTGLHAFLAHWADFFRLAKALVFLLGLYFLYHQDYRRALILPSLAYLFLVLTAAVSLKVSYLEQLLALPGYALFCMLAWSLWGSRWQQSAGSGQDRS